MTRYILSLAFTFAALAEAGAAAPDLKEKSLAAIFAELLPGMSKGDAVAQQRWQELCFLAGAPGMKSSVRKHAG